MQASLKYLSERMHSEQKDVTKDMKGLVMSRNLGSFVEYGVRIVRRLFPDKASDFADGAAEQWEKMRNVRFLPDGWGEDTRNARLVVAMNGVGNAYFDPRPAVVKFLEKTEYARLQIGTSAGSVNSLKYIYIYIYIYI